MPLPADRPSLAPLASELPLIVSQAGVGVSPSDRDTTQEWAGNAEATIARYAGGHLWSLTVFVDIDPAPLAGELARHDTIPTEEAYDLVSQGYVGGLGAVFLNIASIPLTVPDGYVGIAHEIAHAYQAYPVVACSQDPHLLLRRGDSTHRPPLVGRGNRRGARLASLL